VPSSASKLHNLVKLEKVKNLVKVKNLAKVKVESLANVKNAPLLQRARRCHAPALAC